MKNKGFSLVELIVVIAIMAILVGVAVPVYTSYISSAQKNKDIQMVDEIKHALEIGSVGNKWIEKLPNGGLVGIVTITDEGITIEKGASADSTNTLIEDALVAAFGSSYNTDLALSYDEWEGEGTFSYVSASNFKTDVNYLMGDIQTLTNSLATYIETNKDDIAGTGFAQYCQANGLEDSQEIANAAVLYVAKATNKLTEAQRQAFVSQWASPSASFSNMLQGTATNGLSEFAALAAEVARVDAAACYVGCATLKTTTNAAYESISNDATTTTIQKFNDMMQSIYDHINDCDDCANIATYLSSSSAANDANAYLEMLEQVSTAEDYIVSNADSQELYQDQNLRALVDSFVSVASNGNVLIVVSIDPNGSLKLDACPIDG